MLHFLNKSRHQFFKLIFLVLLMETGLVRGQDMHFTQVYAAPIFLNPAFTGANACSRFTLMNRTQWPGVTNPYKSFMLAFDHSLYSFPIGIGMIMGVDEAGAGGLRTTVIKPSFSYEAKIKKHYSLRLAIQPGIGIKSVNFNNLLFGDQIYRGGSSVKTVETPVQSKAYFDFSTGALFTSSNYWAGLSLNHLNMPNESFLNDLPQRLPIEYSVQLGAKIDLNKEEREVHQKKYFSPVLHYRRQNKFDQLDLGFYFTKHIFTLGLWYRGIPVLKAYKPGYQNNDALAIIVGIQTDKMKIGYSYDQTISNLNTVSRGAHEITLSYQLCNPKKRKPKLVLVSCPKF